MSTIRPAARRGWILGGRPVRSRALSNVGQGLAIIRTFATMTASVPGSRSTGQERFAWGLAIFGFALLVRGLQLWQLNDSVVAEMILGDAKNYDTHAREIAGGDWIGDEVFYQAPLYSYFLALPPEKCPFVEIPLHTLISLTPRAYGCVEERIDLDPLVG